MAVSEVLSTEKGTTFYVLTVAGKHGVQPEPVTPSEDGRPPSPPEKPQKNYIASIDISKTFINDVKRQLRVNFLNHLETWLDQAFIRSNSVVVAKCEELNSELDLRLHLHQPRSRRAELDIHNVRAAELMMHSERVTRHSKGIQQSLTDLRTRFSAMSHEHNKLATRFRVDIEALEIVFINATKSSRLMALQNELSVKLEQFMSVIRTSLRQFRQHLDKNLQMLRESNARFIKSFKMFSDGGNFCPDEIEEYRKKLEKMSQKIDQVEGSIMSDLEGMESKRLEQGTKVANEFEDRFKSHMFDLTFMEKIARWLTNTQVKIKAEVAESNSQAQKLSQFLQRLERRIDACENPNPDKEQITSDELYKSLPEVFEAVAERTEYLNCVKGQALSAPRPSSGSILQGNPIAAARVGFISDVTPVSKAGKQPTEDPSVGVIKSILKGIPSKSKIGLEFDYDDDVQPQLGASTTQATTPGLPPDSREKLKSAMSQSSGKGSISSDKSKPVSRRSQMISVDSGQQKRLGSAAALVPFEKKQHVLHLPKISENPTESSSATNINPIKPKDLWLVSRWTTMFRRRNQKAVKFDRKYLVFGDRDEDVDCEYFTGIVRKILRDALDGLLTTADLFYKTKGNRPVTRPQALQESFDGCADAVVQKLQSYFKQSLEYHNDCLQEFRKQLTEFERLVSRVPDLVINDLEKSQINTVQVDRKNIDDNYSPLLLKLRQQQNEHQNSLRPTLGHPHQKESLMALCEKENKRHEEYLELVEKRSQELQNCVVEHSEKFIEVLSRTTENQLLQLDNQIVVDEVKKGRVPPSRYPTSELLRRKAAGESLEDGEEMGMIPRGRGTWPGLPINEMKVNLSEDAQELTATVTTLKTTLAHQAVIMAREQAFENYKAEFYNSLQDIRKAKDLLIKAEERWTDSWKKSVQKVEELY
ncbi:coiled-coil domain-containing protein 180 isoform X2 [Patella vulgata]|uniref:coiled-coil domain-containing protein 180 isoform X2 n=1 Tax=Patella vulgata TaxID=6465 RepID=UPI0021808365|nr:coiled-coil domain-containing protein 180 isoform X2 [Patella vulgata]